MLDVFFLPTYLHLRLDWHPTIKHIASGNGIRSSWLLIGPVLLCSAVIGNCLLDLIGGCFFNYNLKFCLNQYTHAHCNKTIYILTSVVLLLSVMYKQDNSRADKDRGLWCLACNINSSFYSFSILQARRAHNYIITNVCKS